MASRIFRRDPGPPAIPRPGDLFDPVARAFDLIGERWTLVLVRHLLIRPLGFQELRQRTGIAPRVLSTRLRQLVERDFVESVAGDGSRSVYALTATGRTLGPIVAAIARWWVFYAMEAREVGPDDFTASSAQSIVESLPFLLREERAGDAQVVFEIRLTGEGGGVWTVAVERGECQVREGFAEGADVRYTADARVWCAVALGRLDARDAVKRGLMTKEGGRPSLAHYFHQVGSPPARGSGETRKEDET